jgi:uncharacterized cupredoxin-like copper-binding protein
MEFHMRNARALVVVTTIALAGAIAATAATGATKGGSVSVTEKEFKLTPKPASITAGKVTFKVKNVGTLDHELVVLKTTTAPAKLKVKNDRAVETGRVGKIVVKKGKSATLALTLKNGKYVLLCNVKAHYKAGQFAGFTVS